MILLLSFVAAQIAAARPVAPVLTFPERGLDDSAAYRGYETRLFQDARGNTVQVYLDRPDGRVVNLWADAENESIGFTVRDTAGRPAPLSWDAPGALVARNGRTRILEYRLRASPREVRIGHVLLGSMRVERDFQAWGTHRAPFGGAPFQLAENDRFLETLKGLDPEVARAHAALLGASNATELRGRMHPSFTLRSSGRRHVLRATQPSMDLRDTIAVEIIADSRTHEAALDDGLLTLRSRTAQPVRFTVRIATTGAPLTRLLRREIFTDTFLAWADSARRATGAGAATRARWMERQMRGLELLSSREKLMAGLPTYATYFGRDMLVSALMMRTIWRPEMSEFVVGSVLRRLSPTGQVSHEEALGGQAVREAFAEYASLVDAHHAARTRGDRVAADSLLARAATVLRNARLVRENYHMIDDELQFPILTARWLDDPRVPAARKRAFLLGADEDGEPRAAKLLRELALVGRMTDAYARNPVAANLVSFAPRDSGRWQSSSWRDSNVGYANGRFAMDVNAIWAPHALESLGRILVAMRALGVPAESFASRVVDVRTDTPLGRFIRDPGALRSATDAWWGASRHFVVQLDSAERRARIQARLAAMPAVARDYWGRILAVTGVGGDSLPFLALALDADGRPIAVMNTDPATGLFLGARAGSAPAADMSDVLRDVRTFVQPYPAGLLIDRIGPVVANDAFATPSAWAAFGRDPYHGPRVIWGREVNLFVLGAMNRIADARSIPDAAVRDAYVRELRTAAARVNDAAEGSGFHSELWSYDFVDGRPRPIRYGSGADVQLWSTTDLVVQYALSRLGVPADR